VSASVLWPPVNRLEIQPSFDLARVRSTAALQVVETSRESAAQLLATLHLSARDRFRLIAQKIDVERTSSGIASVKEERLVGSLLFTHERSLTRRVYAGISVARADARGAQPLETREVFVKWQWGLASSRGFRPF
jgi:hypothetical protein